MRFQIHVWYAIFLERFTKQIGKYTLIQISINTIIRDGGEVTSVIYESEIFKWFIDSPPRGELNVLYGVAIILNDLYVEFQ